MSGDSDMAADAWPGFVDILSSVIIIFVFFVMIIAGVILFLMLIYTSQIKSISIEQAKKEVAAMVSQENSALRAENIALVVENDDLKRKVKQVAAGFSKSTEQNTEMDERKMIVFYGGDAITVTEKTDKEIRAFVEKYRADLESGKARIRLVGVKNPGAPTESTARNLALARLLNVRNVFVAEQIANESITANIIDSEDFPGKYDWVKVEVVANE